MGARRIVYFLLGTATVLVLLFGYRTSTSSTLVTESSAVAAPSAGSTGTAATGGATTAGGTVTGTTAQTRWGPVQVQVTIADHKITAVDVLQSPSGNRRDIEINDSALPILVQETLSAQSAKIDTVSGATVTSDGYVTSLQSALDQAGW